MRSPRLPTLLALTIALALPTACGGDISDPASPTTAAGDWLQARLVPGSSMLLHLTLRDTTVTGTGTFSIEAGANGTLTVTGIATSSQVSLDMVQSNGTTAHFRGTLATADSMSGSLYYDRDPIFATFLRLQLLKV